MKHFKPNSKANWVLEIDNVVPWKSDPVGREYIWKRQPEDNWKVVFYKSKTGCWERSMGLVSQSPCSWDDEAKFVDMFNEDDVFLLVL